ncbi:hypothetical protein J6590_054230 [Homalodisca vitripennis]|nr:hypothetical protein J6590_054230 [Homalodisca vitripennis]
MPSLTQAEDLQHWPDRRAAFRERIAQRSPIQAVPAAGTGHINSGYVTNDVPMNCQILPDQEQ